MAEAPLETHVPQGADVARRRDEGDSAGREDAGVHWLARTLRAEQLIDRHVSHKQSEI